MLDECHHHQPDNRWGRAIALLSMAQWGVGWTATPIRTDGGALPYDRIIEGPTVSDLIDRGYLAPYRLYGLPQAIDLRGVRRGREFNSKDLGAAAERSPIVGDVVEHYLRYGRGRLGVTFAVSVEMAGRHAQAYRDAGVPAAVLSDRSTDAERAAILRAYRSRELLQVVNVDILGEGFDLPGIEIASLGRPTMSLALHIQQSGRPMRPDPSNPGKIAILLDHVGNAVRHGLPDSARAWSLEGRRPGERTTVHVAVCGNCMQAYEGYEPACPFCGWERPRSDGRSGPDEVAGDLELYDAETLAALRDEAARIAGPAQIPRTSSPAVTLAAQRRWGARATAQAEVRALINQWGGIDRGDSRRGAWRRFYGVFGVDVLQAQIGSAKELKERAEIIRRNIHERD
jgi:superfamily II DNA or RNA helicase